MTNAENYSSKLSISMLLTVVMLLLAARPSGVSAQSAEKAEIPWPATIFLAPDSTQVLAIRGNRMPRNFIPILEDLVSRHEAGKLQPEHVFGADRRSRTGGRTGCPISETGRWVVKIGEIHKAY